MLGGSAATEGVDYGPVTGLGFVPGLRVTPHAVPERREAFGAYLAVRGATGIALEDQTALEVTDQQWRIHTSTADAAAYRIQPDGDTPTVEHLPTDGTYRPVDELR